VKTLDRAAQVLRNANSLATLDELFSELGFPPALLPLDQTALQALGLGVARGARIVKGEGALRGLAVVVDSSTDLREALTGIANALTRNASQLLWIVVALRQPNEVAIVCWRSAAARVRIASLICRNDHVIQSDAETLCMLSAVGGESDLLTHARWLDVLGREAITSRFFRILESTVVELATSLRGRVPTAERRELALLYVSRLVFLSFLESKGWLNGDFCFLSNTYADCIGRGGRYQKLVLEPLFFGTLNTRIGSRSARACDFGRIPFLNGGLFARSVLEKQRRTSVFSDEAFGNAFGNLFTRFRFSGREETSSWSDASIDPEILGKAFEALMANSDRKKSGSYYTPQRLVERLADDALRSFSRGSTDVDHLRQAKVLDPACGSGAFLVYVLERLASQRREFGEAGSIADIRRRVLSSSIFGVDLNPMAVWLCELRLWLSIVIESEESDPMKIAPLPNLDRHIRVGDSLTAGSFDDRGSMLGSRRLASLRTRYMRALGPRKRTLGRELDRLERASAIDVLARRRVRLTVDRKEMLLYLRARDLFGLRHPPDLATQLRLKSLRQSLRELGERVRSLRAGAALPFSFDAHFPDIAASGGFDCVIGNPPWVRIHRIEAGARQKFRQEFKVYRNAPWRSGAEQSGAGRGFAAQVDLSALFVERGCGLARAGGVIAYLLPSKLWRSLSGGGVRELLLEHTRIVMIEDLSDSRSEFDAAVYPSLLIARKRADDRLTKAETRNAQETVADDLITVTVRSAGGRKRWRCAPHRLSVDGPGSPWMLLPGAVRKAFDRVTRAGVPLRVTPFGRPQLGVKTGCNGAYLVRVDSIDGDVARISTSERTGVIERSLLRPVIRGETLTRWKATKPGEYIVWPHDEHAHPLRALPPLGRAWLLPFRDALSQRTDLHDARRWWSVFRTEGATSNEPRVIWADFGLHPRAMVIAEGDKFVPLNTCYVVHIPKMVDAFALAAILNGPLATAWLNAIAEPARGGYRRYLGWTMAMLPVPTRWGRVRKVLSPLGERGMEGDIPSDSDLLDAALDAYLLRREKVQPLLDWGIACD
jgi:hypothetical protein